MTDSRFNFMRITNRTLVLALAVVWAGSLAHAGDLPQFSSPPGALNAGGPDAMLVSPEYVLRPGDVVQVKVYQEDDLASTSRIGPDGSIALPLVGSVRVGSNTVSHATATIASLLAKDYLVNPQVTLNVTEFAKRRFTVLGQVQRAGTYEMPTHESVNLLQAIAAAGGFTRIGNPRRITIQRTVGSENQKINLDSEAMSKKKEQPFFIRPDDVVTVGEKWI
jgi:polysaccharide export outer membrane protein